MHRTFQRGKPSPPAEEEDGARRASSRCGGERARGGEPEARSPRTPGEPVSGGRARVPEFRTTSARRGTASERPREMRRTHSRPWPAESWGQDAPSRDNRAEPTGNEGRPGPPPSQTEAERPDSGGDGGVRAAPQRSPHLSGTHGLRAPPRPAKDPQQQQQSLGAWGAERGRGQGLGRDGLEEIEFRGSGDRDLPRFTTPVRRRVI